MCFSQFLRVSHSFSEFLTSIWYVSARRRISVKLSDAKSPVLRAKSATALSAASDGTLSDIELLDYYKFITVAFGKAFLSGVCEC